MALFIMVITIYKHVKVFHGFSQVGDFYYKAIYLAIQSMVQTPLSQSIKIQNSTKSLFLNVDLVCKGGFKQRGQNKVIIESAYISHAHIYEFL
jgi:hypothetical protein